MINKIVVKKVIRAFFGKREPVEVMVGFYDDKGREVGSQLLDAALFEDDVVEGQSINFRKIHTPFYDYMNSTPD